MREGVENYFFAAPVSQLSVPVDSLLVQTLAAALGFGPLHTCRCRNLHTEGKGYHARLSLRKKVLEAFVGCTKSVLFVEEQQIAMPRSLNSKCKCKWLQHHIMISTALELLHGANFDASACMSPYVLTHHSIRLAAAKI